MIQPKSTDTRFMDSPSAGDPDCLCSRCGDSIGEDEAPIRMWPEVGVEVESEEDVYEYRYCESCQQKSGIHFYKGPEEEDIFNFDQNEEE